MASSGELSWTVQEGCSDKRVSYHLLAVNFFYSDCLKK